MKYQLLYFFLIQLAIIHSQICNLRNAEKNLITITADEFYQFNLGDYFYGDSLVFTLNKKFEYFQASNNYQLGKYLKNIKSITSFNIKGKTYSSLFAHFVLIERTDKKGAFYQISKIQQDLDKFMFSISNYLSEKLYKNCYCINQFKQYLLVTCFDQEKNNFEFYFYDSKLLAENPLTVKLPLEKEINFAKIKTLSGGDYVGIQLIADNEQFSGDLLIFKFNFNRDKKEFKGQLVGQFKNINSFEIAENKLFFVTNSEAGFTYCNLQDDTIDVIENDILNQIYFGISFYEIETNLEDYYITLWNQYGIVIFIWNPSKPIITNKYYSTTQISRENCFNTDVYINEMYLSISNINGISIYPSIFNDQNEGHQLYYYQVKSLFSSYHFKLNFLFSIQPTGLFVYEIDNYMFQLSNLKTSAKIQKVTLNARTNQFNTPSVDCPQFVFYYQVLQNPIQFEKQSNFGERFYQSDENEEKPIFKIKLKQLKQENNQYVGKININEIFFGSFLTIDKLTLENPNNQEKQILQTKAREFKMKKVEYQDSDEDYEKIIWYSEYFERNLFQSLNRDLNCYFQILQFKGVHKINKSVQHKLIFQKCCFNREQKNFVCEKLIEELKFKYIIQLVILHEHKNNLYLSLLAGAIVDPFLWIYKFQILDRQYKLTSNTLKCISRSSQEFISIMSFYVIKGTLYLCYKRLISITFVEKTQMLMVDLEKILESNNCLLFDFEPLNFSESVTFTSIMEHIYGPFLFAKSRIENKDTNSFRESLLIYIIDGKQLTCVGEIRNKKENSLNKQLQYYQAEFGFIVSEQSQNQYHKYLYSKIEFQKILFSILSEFRTIYFEDIPRKLFPIDQNTMVFIHLKSFYIVQQETSENGQKNYPNYYLDFFENKLFQIKINDQKQFLLKSIQKRNGKDLMIFEDNQEQDNKRVLDQYEIEWDRQQEFQFFIQNIQIEEQRNYYLNLLLSREINSEVKLLTQLKVQFEILDENENFDENEFQDQKIRINK